MTTAPWPEADPELERIYRKLLLAYPGRYRRRHGSEMVTTLLEMAEPGRRRPHPADALHLVASGLRQRLRLPARRPLAWIAAVLAMLITGAFGAAAGSWIAERTFAAVPDETGIEALRERVVGTSAGEHFIRSESGSPWWGRTTMADTSVQALGWDVEQARQRLRADGWQVSAVQPMSGSISRLDAGTGALVEIPSVAARFTAERDGVRIQVRSHLSDLSGRVSVDAWAADNGSLLPLIVIGGIAGLLAGWLLAAAAAHRLRGVPAARARFAAVLLTFALPALALPAVALYGNVMRAFRYAGNPDPVFTVHSAFWPGTYWPFGPPWLNLTLTGAGTLLAMVALGTTFRGRQHADDRVPATAN